MRGFSDKRFHQAVFGLMASLDKIRGGQDLADYVHANLRPYVDHDWLSFYIIWKDSGDGRIITNREVTFDLDKLYHEVIGFDKFHRLILGAKIGDIVLTQDYPPETREDLAVAEFINAKTGAYFSANIPLAVSRGLRSFVALYRNDPCRPFTPEETAALHDFAEVLTPLAEFMLRSYELKMQMLANPDGKKRCSILLDQHLRTVGFAEGTTAFLEELMRKPMGMETLVRIHDWVRETIMPGWQEQHSGPWSNIFPLAEECIYCDARIIEDEFHNRLLMVEMDAPRKRNDFSFLAKFGLSKYQIAVLSYLPLGYTNKQIADAIGIKEVTVKKHLHHIGVKLHALGKTEILFQAMFLREESEPI